MSDEVYQGPIVAGMRFIWEGANPFARTHIEVTRIVEVPGDERRIFSVATFGEDRKEYWNDESRFREAVNVE